MGSHRVSIPYVAVHEGAVWIMLPDGSVQEHTLHHGVGILAFKKAVRALGTVMCSSSVDFPQEHGMGPRESAVIARVLGR